MLKFQCEFSESSMLSTDILAAIVIFLLYLHSSHCDVPSTFPITSTELQNQSRVRFVESLCVPKMILNWRFKTLGAPELLSCGSRRNRPSAACLTKCLDGEIFRDHNETSCLIRFMPHYCTSGRFFGVTVTNVATYQFDLLLSASKSNRQSKPSNQLRQHQAAVR